MVLYVYDDTGDNVILESFIARHNWHIDRVSIQETIAGLIAKGGANLRDVGRGETLIETSEEDGLRLQSLTGSIGQKVPRENTSFTYKIVVSNSALPPHSGGR